MSIEEIVVTATRGGGGSFGFGRNFGSNGAAPTGGGGSNANSNRQSADDKATISRIKAEINQGRLTYESFKAIVSNPNISFQDVFGENVIIQIEFDVVGIGSIHIMFNSPNWCSRNYNR